MKKQNSRGNPRRWKKSFVIFLALAMFVCTPISATGVYAFEGEQPPGDAAAIHSGITAATPPAFMPGYPKSGGTQLPGSKQVSITISVQEPCDFALVLLPDGAIAPSNTQVAAGQDSTGAAALDRYSGSVNTSIVVGLIAPLDDTEYDVYVVLDDTTGNLSEPANVDVRTPVANLFEVSNAAALESALGKVTDGGTIRLTDNIDYDRSIEVDGKTITFDVGSHILNVSSTDSVAGVGLEVKNGGHVNLSGSGQLNVTHINGSGSSVGVLVRENSSAIVTNVKSVSGVGTGIYADGDGAVVRVMGNVEAIGSSSYGAKTWGDGQITIDGTVTAKYYINIGGEYKAKTDGAEDPTKHGYLKYSDPSAKGTVWVKDITPAGGMVCEINGTQYDSLDNALAAASSGGTIKLLQNIDYKKGIVLDNKTLTFDLNGCVLNVVNPAQDGDGISVANGGNLYLKGNGALNATGERSGVTVASNYARTEATVTNATATAPDGKGAYVYNAAILTVLSDAKATAPRGIGAHALERGTLTVKGNAVGESIGACASNAYLTVEGDTVAASTDYLGRGSGIGVEAYNCVVTVKGNVIANRVGAWPTARGSIIVDGTITAPSYIQLTDDVVKGPNDFETVTTKEGYRTYYHTFGNTVWVKGDAPAVYPLIVKNGTGSGNYVQGAAVTLQADENAVGKTFRLWTTASSGSFDNANSAITLFAMPASAATVTAEFDTGEPMVTTGTITNISAASADVAGNVTNSGASIVTMRGFVYGPAVNPVIGGPGVANVTAGNGTGAFAAKLTGLSANTPYHVRAYAINSKGISYGADVSFITLSVANNGGSGHSGGGSSSGSVRTYNAEVKSDTAQPEVLPLTVDTLLNTGSASLGAEKAEKLFNTNTGSVITMPSIPGVNAYTLELPGSSLNNAQGTGVLTLSTVMGSIVIPNNMLSGLSGTNEKKAGITIAQGDKRSLTDAEKALIGQRPLIQLNLVLDGVRAEWNNPNAPVTVSIPYTPAAEELKNPESIMIWYIDSSGKAVSVSNGHYNPAAGTVTFTTTHFSGYAVGYNKVSFKDVAASAWYSKAVSFIAARGITTGMGNGNYLPEAKLTRAQFMVILMKSYEIAPDVNPKENFSDAGNTYYTDYLSAAKRLGITVGVGDNLYEPEREITRQEMFALLYNALKVMGKLPQGDSGRMLSDFSDAGQIDSWAKEAMMLLVETGTIGGNDGKLSPESTATRAEMAQMMYILLSK